jgi:hypothetical protein
MYTILVVMITPFIKLYTAGVTDIEYLNWTYVVMFTVVGILNCMRTPGGTIINAAGHYKETKNRALIEMGICVVLELLLVNKFGIIGILIATGAAFLYRTIDVIIYSHRRILNIPITKSLFRIFFNLSLLIILYCLLSVYDFGNINSYMSWFIHSSVVGVIILLSYLIIGFIFENKSFSLAFRYLKDIRDKKHIDNRKD